jgi:hypothetical protein
MKNSTIILTFLLGNVFHQLKSSWDQIKKSLSGNQGAGSGWTRRSYRTEEQRKVE